MQLPLGTILIWMGAGNPPAGWEILTATHHNKPIRGYADNTFAQSSPRSVSGTSHSHTTASSSTSTTVVHNHTAPLVNFSHAGGVSDAPGGGGGAASATHTHTLQPAIPQHSASHAHTTTIGVTSEDTTPAYKSIVLIVKTS